MRIARKNVLAIVVLAVILCAFAVGRTAAQSEFVAPEVDTALAFLGFTRADFESDRIWAEDDTFLLPKIREALRSPLTAYGVAREFAQSVPHSTSEAANIAEMANLLSAPCDDAMRREIDAQLRGRSPQSDPFEPMLTAFALADRFRNQAFSQLSDVQKNALVSASPLWFEDEEDSNDDTLRGMVPRAFGKSDAAGAGVSSDSILTLLALVNRGALTAATYAWAEGLSLTVEHWKNARPPFSATAVPGVTGLALASRETPYGTFVLGGSGPNTYTGDFALIVDLGGDDEYFCRVASAVWGVNRALSALLDMNGNDLYVSNHIADQACGILGLAAMVDVSGNDTYRCGAFGQASAICGAALFFDEGGDDVYQAGLFSQAAALCGIAVLVDRGGRDTYDLTQYGQGCASTFGAAALVDEAGNDIYRAGGSVLHAPLLPEDYRSFAQGFAIGHRPRGGGGFGLLHDLQGNDFYCAEVYAQGTAYWYSLGCLLDDSGNDIYSATQYTQAAGIHLAAGVLVDGAGDDRYASRFGPGQGGAHDLSVAFLYDQSGDDQYMMSGGQGMAITNSAALFFDRTGNDSYFTRETDLGQGGVRDARGFGNVGVFADGEGHDVFSDDVKADSAVWFQGWFGVGYDVPRDSVRPREAPVSAEFVPSDTLRSVADLFHEASLWEVTDNRARVRRARLALAAKGAAAIRWVGENKLNTYDGLERRAIIELFKTLPDTSAPFLFAALNSEDHVRRRNAAVILGELKYKPGVALLLDKLRDPSCAEARPAMLTALGDIGDASAADVLLEFSQSQTERERIAATVSLSKMDDKRSRRAILTRLSDSLYTVRSAAMVCLASQKAEILPELKDHLSSAEGADLETTLLATSRMADHWRADTTQAKSTSKLGSLLSNYLSYPEIRIQAAAYVACAGLLDERQLDKAKARLETSLDPVVRARLVQAQNRK